MIEHIGNCHGEWNFLGYFMMAAGAVPLIGPWLKQKWNARVDKHKEKHA